MAQYVNSITQYESYVRGQADVVEEHYRRIRNMESDNNKCFSGDYYKVFYEKQELLDQYIDEMKEILNYDCLPEIAVLKRKYISLSEKNMP